MINEELLPDVVPKKDGINENVLNILERRDKSDQTKN
jgi:hypothetical protein